MSKRFIVVLLSVILLSACSFQYSTVTPPAPEIQQPTFSNTLESVPTVTATPLITVATEQQSSPAAASVDRGVPVCPGAPAVHVAVGQQVTVMVEDFDKLKLRETPETSSNFVKELPRSTLLQILEGPVCVTSTDAQGHYLFWKVQVVPTGEIGWVAEGDSLHYFVEIPTPQPTATVVIQLPTASTCPGAPAAHVSVGQKITVITEDYDKLKLRSEPSFTSEKAKELAKFTQLKVLEGPICVPSTEPGASFLFWKVMILDITGETGWIAEGNTFYYFVQ